uniref:MAPK regulated corepressor interacting protein 1 n=1 Tax=Canis lupus familiaris TaxID=9615 RepID=A0A8I3N702_CANLF
MSKILLGGGDTLSKGPRRQRGAASIWLCARKEFETAGLEAGHRVPHDLSPAQEVSESPWFPCKSKRPRGPGSAAQGPDAPAMTRWVSGSGATSPGGGEGRGWAPLPPAHPHVPGTPSSPVSRVVYNGKRNSSPRSPPSSTEIFTPAHEENVRFIYEAWQGVERDLRSQMSGSERGLVEEYVEKVPNPSLKTFKPIDLSDLKRRNTPDTKKS